MANKRSVEKVSYESDNLCATTVPVTLLAEKETTSDVTATSAPLAAKTKNIAVEQKFSGQRTGFAGATTAPLADKAVIMATGPVLEVGSTNFEAATAAPLAENCRVKMEKVKGDENAMKRRALWLSCPHCSQCCASANGLASHIADLHQGRKIMRSLVFVYCMSLLLPHCRYNFENNFFSLVPYRTQYGTAVMWIRNIFFFGFESRIFFLARFGFGF
jgi:hypothetical protein